MLLYSFPKTKRSQYERVFARKTICNSVGAAGAPVAGPE